MNMWSKQAQGDARWYCVCVRGEAGRGGGGVELIGAAPSRITEVTTDEEQGRAPHMEIRAQCHRQAAAPNMSSAPAKLCRNGGHALGGVWTRLAKQLARIHRWSTPTWPYARADADAENKAYSG